MSSNEHNGCRGLRILVVEDDRDFAESLSLLLGMDGHEVKVAADGLAAMQLAQVKQPDVVLLDIGLPGMDGFQVARGLGELPAVKKPLLVAISGHGQEECLQRSREAGIDLHLLKPVDPKQLTALLKRFHAIIGD